MYKHDILKPAYNKQYVHCTIITHIIFFKAESFLPSISYLDGDCMNCLNKLSLPHSTAKSETCSPTSPTYRMGSKL